MKKTLYRLTSAFFAIVVSFAAVLALAGCGSSKTTDSSNSSKTDKKAVEAVAGDYYLDLSELGMKLVIYLRLTENGHFSFLIQRILRSIKAQVSFRKVQMTM